MATTTLNLKNTTTAKEDKSNTLRLRIKVSKIETETKSFNAYKVLNKQKRWVDLRLTKAVKNVPELDKGEKTKEYYIYVKPENINYTENYQYPRFWVRAIESVEEIETTKQNIEEYFDVDVNVDEDSPF